MAARQYWDGQALAIQVHGGYGYTRDYAVEQFYRDNRLNMIHEGTNGIQALDLLGRKMVMGGGAGLGLLAKAILQTTGQAAASADPEVAEYAAALTSAVERLALVTQQAWKDRDPELALANAALYLEAAGHIVVAWIWLDQLLAVGDQPASGEAGGKDSDFYAGKRAAARYFFRYELPGAGPKLDLVASLDRTALDVDPSVL